MSDGAVAKPGKAGRSEAEAWWRTGIIEMRPAGAPEHRRAGEWAPGIRGAAMNFALSQILD